MKTIVTLSYLFLTLIFNNMVFAQNITISDNLFVRVYNFEGEKISKGKVISVSDTMLQLKKNSKIININPKDIGMIKTKRSEGNNILVGSLIGATAGALVGAQIGKATAEPDEWFGYNEQEGSTFGAIFGIPAGAATGATIGWFTILFKKSKTFFINGNILKWKLFQEAI